MSKCLFKKTKKPRFLKLVKREMITYSEVAVGTDGCHAGVCTGTGTGGVGHRYRERILTGCQERAAGRRCAT